MKNSICTNFYFVIYQDDLPSNYFAFALTNVSGVQEYPTVNKCILTTHFLWLIFEEKKNDEKVRLYFQ